MGLSGVGTSTSYSSYTGTEQSEVAEDFKRDEERVDDEGIGEIAATTTDEGVEAVYGYTGRALRNVISVGIGGSYLGPCYVSEVLATEREGIYSSQGFTLRFLSNVDPVDFER